MYIHVYEYNLFLSTVQSAWISDFRSYIYKTYLAFNECWRGFGPVVPLFLLGQIYNVRIHKYISQHPEFVADPIEEEGGMRA